MILLAHDLTDRELLLVKAASDPLVTYRDMAASFGTTHQVIKNQMHELFIKLGADNRWHAVKLAQDRGII